MGPRRTDKKLIKRYLARQTSAKLHIGCGDHILPGWLNAELDPTEAEVVALDASQPFPFADETFDFIFSEHMIEHLPYAEGLEMLKECHRVLKNKGTIRITTPNLAFLVDLYREDKSDLQQDYITWHLNTILERYPYYEDTFVMNNFVRDWGHRFIYDEKTLRTSMERSGFGAVARCALNESEHDELRALENEQRLPEGFLRLESFTLEGTKEAQG